MTIAMRPLTGAELDIADIIQSVAYSGGSRRAQLEMYLALQPDGWILATFDGKPVGLAGATHFGSLAYIGLVSVLPAMQRRGIANAMMQYLLGWLRERGNPPIVLDASAAGAPLYEGLGFVDDGKTVMYHQDDCARLPALSGSVAPLAADNLAELAAFDAPIFGANRTAVFRYMFEAHPERAFIARNAQGQLDGFLFAQTAAIGPWVAQTPDEAEGLLAAALRLEYAEGPRVLAPSVNGDVSSLLMRYGFSPQRALRHLTLDSAGPIGQRALVYGQASFAIG